MWDRPAPKAVLALAVAIGLLVWKGPVLLTALRADSLMTTAGVITQAPETVSSLGANRDQIHRVSLEYRFEVDGATFTSDRVGLLSNRFPTRDQAVRFADRHGLDDTVEVHYDPAAPERACLAPPRGFEIGLVFWIGGIAAAFGAAGWFGLTALRARA